MSRAGSGDAVSRFREALRGFQEGFEERFGFKLFEPLRENDRHKEVGLRIPPNDDAEEFDRQLLYLAILLPDSIDVRQLHRYVDSREKVEDGRKLAVLEAFLKKASLSTDIVYHLQIVQDLRSSGAAHRRGDRYAELAAKYGLDETRREEFFCKLLGDVTKALDGLR